MRCPTGLDRSKPGWASSQSKELSGSLGLPAATRRGGTRSPPSRIARPSRWCRCGRCDRYYRGAWRKMGASGRSPNRMMDDRHGLSGHLVSEASWSHSGLYTIVHCGGFPPAIRRGGSVYEAQHVARSRINNTVPRPTPAPHRAPADHSRSITNAAHSSTNTTIRQNPHFDIVLSSVIHGRVAVL